MPSYHVVTGNGRMHKASPREIQSLPWLPDEIEIPLGAIARHAHESLMTLFVQVGLAVLKAAMENEVVQRVGPKGKHQPERQAYRHGYELGWAVIGGRKVHLQRPRMRQKGGGEVPLERYAWVQQDDSLDVGVLARMLHEVSTRAYAALGGYRRDRRVRYLQRSGWAALAATDGSQATRASEPSLR